jgi:hypothetical protein
MRVRLGLFLNRAGLAMLVVATATMLGWGIIAILSNHNLNTLSTTLVNQAIGQRAGGLLYIGAALVAGWGILHPGTRGFVLGLFQNSLLWLSAGRVLYAIAQQRYAGGTAALAAPADFIATDQLLVIMAALGHMFSLFIYHGLAAATQRLAKEGGDGR